MARRANRLPVQEQRGLRQILSSCRWWQSRGQTADKRGSTEMPRWEPGRPPKPLPGIFRISWRGARPMHCSTCSSRRKSESRYRAC